MVYNTTLNNISDILWQSILLMEYPENTTNLPQVNDKLYHIMGTTSCLSGIQTHNVSVDRH